MRVYNCTTAVYVRSRTNTHTQITTRSFFFFFFLRSDPIFRCAFRTGRILGGTEVYIQKRILTDKLQACFIRLEYRRMTMKQMRYVMNAVVIPKFTYALSVTANHATTNSSICVQMDSSIREFVLSYFQLSKSTASACVHAPLDIWGLGINSIEHKVAGRNSRPWHRLDPERLESQQQMEPSPPRPARRRTTQY
jgi:hypothetical protein